MAKGRIRLNKPLKTTKYVATTKYFSLYSWACGIFFLFSFAVNTGCHFKKTFHTGVLVCLPFPNHKKILVLQNMITCTKNVT